ncbi:MAG: DUF1501 domain-containing protein [Polyangiaceae bacterium]|nr:DUF1501 domain-containing protein [Polyangiaceae bacterium]
MALSRRKMLLGGLGAASAGLFGLGRSARAEGERPAKNLIMILVYGGWDVTYALDPKPGLSTIDVPAGAIETLGGLPIFTHASRPATRSFFEAWGSSTTLVNGISVQSINHPDCTKRILTGTASETNPDAGAIAAFELAPDLPAPYLVLGPTAYTGPLASIAARTGTLTQVRGLMDPTLAFPRLDPTVPRFSPTEAETSMVAEYVKARAERERVTRGARGYNAKRIDDFVKSLDRGESLKGFSGAFGEEFAFTLDLRVQVDIALRAISEGLSHTVHLEQTFALWDTHSGNELQAPLFEDLMGALSLLATELASRPGKAAGSRLLDETVVAVVSEMSRTPKLNDAMGKDHWPVTSAMFFGGGIPGGRVLGATGENLEALAVDLATGTPTSEGTILQYSNLVAGLLGAVGVDSEAYLPNAEPFHALIG